MNKNENEIVYFTEDELEILIQELLDLIPLGNIVKLFNLDTYTNNGHFDFKKDSFYCEVCNGTVCHCASSMNDQIYTDLYVILNNDKELFVQIKKSGFIESFDDIKLSRLIKTYFKKA